MSKRLLILACSQRKRPDPGLLPAIERYDGPQFQVHNLWTLLDEARQIDEYLTAGTYIDWYMGHIQNSTYLPLIQQAATWLDEE